MLVRNRLPDQVDVTLGPREIVSRFVLQGDREVRERGIRLSLESDFEALIAFNKSQPEECTFCNAPSGRRVSGLVCYSGGAWYHPDYRGLGLASIIPRLSRTIAYSRWNTDFTVGVAESVLIEKGVVARDGYSRVEEGLNRLNSFIGHLLNLHLLWIDRNEMLNDLVTQLSEPVEYRHRASARM